MVSNTHINTNTIIIHKNRSVSDSRPSVERVVQDHKQTVVGLPDHSPVQPQVWLQANLELNCTQG